jgi:hypothetical protein
MFFIVVAATYGLLNNKSHSNNVPIPKSGKVSGGSLRNGDSRKIGVRWCDLNIWKFHLCFASMLQLPIVGLWPLKYIGGVL